VVRGKIKKTVKCCN